jgi:four helix bundle protein
VEKPHKKLEVWRLSMEIAEEMYRVTDSFPPSEKFGIISQLRRASVSIPSNIAEGAGRNTRKEFVNFLHIAQGSLSELDTQLELSRRLGYIKEEEWKALDKKLDREDKMLTGLIKSQKAIQISKGCGVKGKETAAGDEGGDQRS